MNTKLPDVFYLGFFIFTTIAIFVGAFWIISTEKRLKRFFIGKKAKDLEDTIIELEKEIAKLNIAKEKIEEKLLVISNKTKQSIRGLETIRFNPFSDQGSNHSFAIAMLNEDGDGVVLSSLYARDRMSVFAKPIKNNKSEYELSNEEKEVLSKIKI